MADDFESGPRTDPILLLQSGGPGLLDLRVSPAHADQLRECLESEGLHFSEVIEFSAANELVVLGISLAAGGALPTALKVAITKFFERHKDKSVTFGAEGQVESMTGFSRGDIEKVLNQVDQLQSQRDQQRDDT